MLYRLLADALLLAHFAFIVFVVAGALLVARRRRLLPWHLAAAVYGVAIEATGAPCPLTGAEVYLRGLAGDGGYAGGFIDHYLLPLIYPAALTADMQYWLAGVVVVANLLLYGLILRRAR